MRTNKLASVLETLEMQTLYDTGVGRVMGGFAVAEMFNRDADYIDIELKWGITNDAGSEVHTEQYKLPTPCLDHRPATEIIQDLMDA